MNQLRRPTSLALLVLVISGLGCGRARTDAAAPGRPSGRPALRVRTAQVEARDVVYSVRAVGSLEAEELVQVTAEVEGAVSQVRFNEGDRVSSETVLVRIDPERYRLEAQRAEAGYAKAEADALRAQQELGQRERLFGEQLVSVEELNRARAERERLAGEAGSVRAARDLALANLRRADVRAPRAGTIDTRKVSTGQFVKPGDVLATIVDVSRLRLRFKVSEAESISSKQGATLSFKVGPLGDRKFQAAIYHVGQVADAATRQVEVLAWVRNPGELKPGFFAEVELATETHPKALVVPESAVQASEKGFVAYVVEASGTARQRALAIGLRTKDGHVEILSGLKAGEAVVVEGSDRLADGTAVQVAGPLEGVPSGKDADRSGR